MDGSAAGTAPRVPEEHGAAGSGPVGRVYTAELAARGFHSDPAQLRAVQALEDCAQSWAAYRQKRSNALKKLLNRPEVPRGVYLHGGVGRGKSFLMDCFFAAVPIRRKVRLHFHEFMREVHREMVRLQGTPNPLDALGAAMAKKYKLICFDEFHVADVTDAMILHRLLQALFAHRVGFVTTSNFHPDGLYPDGLHRDRILPAIELLKARMKVLNVDHGTDYRQRTLQDAPLYHCPPGPAADAAMEQLFDQLRTTPQTPHAAQAQTAPVVRVDSRSLHARRLSGGVVWFDFRELCGGPRSQNDYLEIASRFHTVLLSDVPQMAANMASSARRFTWLVDVLYDRRVKLVLSAAAPPEQLYTRGPLAHEFVRTASRLREMQSTGFLELQRREVDTRLT